MSPATTTMTGHSLRRLSVQRDTALLCRGMNHGPETPSVATSSSGMRYVGLGAVALVAITALGAARHAVVLESGGASRVQRDRFFDRMTSNDLKLHAQHVARGRGAVFFKRELAKTAAELSGRAQPPSAGQ